MCSRFVEELQFVRYIDAVVLWVVRRWNRCSYPSQALRASSPGGRAKGSASIGRQSDGFRSMELLKVRTQLLPLPPGEVPPAGRGRGIVQTVRAGSQFVRYTEHSNPIYGSV